MNQQTNPFVSKIKDAQVSDEYLTFGCMMIAEQFIHDETIFDTKEEFFREVEYLVSVHCPIMYRFSTRATLHGGLPVGMFDVILEMIRKQKPLFLAGGEANESPKLILPNA